MKNILCVDLDQTLLARNDNIFILRSIDELCRSIQSMPDGQCKSRMEAAIKKMIHRDTISQTLYEVFLSEFCDGNEQDRQKIAADLLHYYDTEYHAMQQYTSIIPEGIQFVKEAVRKNFKIVIATNPIYPLNALQQRVQWAGLADMMDKFLFITTMEDFHFTKPDPAYYVEILGRLAWPEDTRVVMIGDSLEMDIIPASRAGIPGYWLGDGLLPDGLNPFCANGTYDGIFPWIEQINEQPEAAPSQNTGLDLLAHLKTTPAVFDSICRSVTEKTGCSRPEISKWALVEIICHLRDMDRDVNISRFVEVFQQENPFISHIDTSSWAEDRKYREENGHEAAQEFIDNRLKLIDLLAEHQDEWYEKTARHSIFGPVCVADLIQFIVTHDRMHIRQAYDTLERVRSIT